ncbi:MAG: 1,4-dihydroxy-2-naphthoate octaprenyltransferase [Crocinitomicaceae bacterium]
MKNWLKAFRLRTLPLSLSGIILGSFLAKSMGTWSMNTFLLAMFTTILFQILSNLANDLGDTLKGADNENRVGPKRTVQEGGISISKMKSAIVIFSVLSIISSSFLIRTAINLSNVSILFYIILAVLCIVAAITYTMGKKAYGYLGLGDFFVFIFFGLVSVLGVIPLYTNSFDWIYIFPASTIGFLSTAVLNLNNMRDQINDREVGKNTLVVKIGAQNAKIYHTLLIVLSATSLLLFSLIIENYIILYSLVIYIVLIKHLKYVWDVKDFKQFDSELKKVALCTFFIAIIFSLLINI